MDLNIEVKIHRNIWLFSWAWKFIDFSWCWKLLYN